MSEVTLLKKTTKLTEGTNIWKAIAMHWSRGKWGAVILVSTLATTEIRSNLHTYQYAGSVPPNYSQGQVLVESVLFPGVTRHINKFLCEAAQKGGSGLTMHTILSQSYSNKNRPLLKSMLQSLSLSCASLMW